MMDFLLIEVLPIVLGVGLFFTLLIAPIAGFSTYIERRVSAKMQSRIGCNRLGPEGIVQFLADGIKLLAKEDFVPPGGDPFLFKFAPYLVMVGAFASFACIPFGTQFVLADVNVGIIYLLALSSIVVIGIMLAGWASNNKWSMLGSLRSAAQIVSYEIPLGLSLLIPVLLTGSLNLQTINQFQQGGSWIVFAVGPFSMLAFLIYFISALAEVNRTPFDLPEAESELVGGFHTEYSGIRWGLFFIAEYANMFLVSAIAVTCFLGGYQKSLGNIPFLCFSLYYVYFFLFQVLQYLPSMLVSMFKGQTLLDVFMNQAPLKVSSNVKKIFIFLAIATSILFYQIHEGSMLIEMFTFISKSYFLVFVIMWIRWSLPRYRIDQLMDLCWKKLIPFSFVCVLGTLFWMVFA